MGGRGDPGRPVHLRRGVLAGRPARRSRSAGPSGPAGGPSGSGHAWAAERPLGLGAGPHRGVRVREGGEHRVTLGEQGHTVARAQGTPKYRPVLGEHRPVLGAEHLRQPGRSLNVGEEECHQSARQVEHCRHGEPPPPWKFLLSPRACSGLLAAKQARGTRESSCQTRSTTSHRRNGLRQSTCRRPRSTHVR